MLQLLEGFDLHRAGLRSPDHIRHFVEAKKLAYEDRARFYADPQFYDPPVAALFRRRLREQRRPLMMPHTPRKIKPRATPRYAPETRFISPPPIKITTWCR